MKKFLLLSALWLVFVLVSYPCASPIAATQPKEPSTIIFILDASGSMWGQVEGRAKIDIAKEVMKSLIKDLPQTASVGLVAYGHRTKGDCNDVEELVPLKAINKDELVKKIDAINPKGMTPITLSVQLTAEKLKSVEQGGTIILVSDGKETCKGDPCALVKELKQAGVKFVMHVIGFDVTEEEKTQLECMAKAGGGSYFTAKTASDLKSAAKKAVEQVPKGGYLRVVALREGKPFAADLTVYQAGKKDSLFTTRTVINQTDKGERLEAGKYDLKTIDSENQTRPEVALAGIVVEDGKTTEKTVDFSGGTLVLKVIKNQKPSFAYIEVRKNGTEAKVASGDTSMENPQSLRLSAGTYDVHLTDDKVSPPLTITLTGIDIKPAATVEKTVDFSEGRLKVKVLKGGQPYLGFIYIFKAGTEEKVAASDTSVDNPEEFKLLPGSYDIRVKDDESDPPVIVTIKGVQVEGNKTVEKTADYK